MNPGDVAVSFFLFCAAFIALRLWERRLGHRVGDPDHQRCDEEIARLNERFEEQKRRDSARIQELERRVDFLVELLERNGQPASLPAPAQPERLAKPLALICGPDATMCDLDRQALRRARVPFQRLRAATRPSIDNDFRRQRQDGKMYPWVHVATHAGPSGIQLADGIAPPAWWNEMLTGVEVVLLAACSTADVADALAGLVTVVYVLEDIDSRDASDFCYAFWRQMREHRDPLRAYRQAIAEVPQVAEYTDVRTG